MKMTTINVKQNICDPTMEIFDLDYKLNLEDKFPSFELDDEEFFDLDELPVFPNDLSETCKTTDEGNTTKRKLSELVDDMTDFFPLLSQAVSPMQTRKRTRVRRHSTVSAYFETGSVSNSESRPASVISNFEPEPELAAKRKFESKRWFAREDIFLTASVMEVYYRRHSLKPNADEKRVAASDNIATDKIIWGKIKATYIQFCKRFETLTTKRTTERTMKALQRRWKITGKKEDFIDKDGVAMPLSKYYHRLFDKYFNHRNLLLCSKEHFERSWRSRQISYADILKMNISNL